MKVRDLIERLAPFKNFDVVIVDNSETLISKDIDVCLTPDYLVENDTSKHITAIPDADDNVTGKVVYIYANGYDVEDGYWSKKG